MLKKALTPISLVVLAVGIGLILYSTLGGDDSDSATTVPDVSVVEESSTTSAVSDSIAPSGTTEPAAAGTTVAATSTTAAPSGSPSSLIIPSLPSIAIPPSSFISIPPGMLDLFSCESFQECAQKLYDAWKTNSKVLAASYATPAAVDALFAYSYAASPGTWSTSVSPGFTPNSFIALSNRSAAPKSIQFKYDAGVSGFKVNLVQVF